MALANLYLTLNDLPSAQAQCLLMLRHDLLTSEATLLLSAVLFQLNSYSEAVYHFRSLLEKDPCNFEALEKAIDMMRRGGKLEEVDGFLSASAKKLSLNLETGDNGSQGGGSLNLSGSRLGLSYCRGVYLR